MQTTLHGIKPSPSAVMPDRRHATLGDGHILEVAQMNPKGLVMSHERMHVHGLSHIREGGANGFGMCHDVVEVGAAQLPVAEGAPVDASSKVLNFEIKVLVLWGTMDKFLESGTNRYNPSQNYVFFQPF